MKPSFVTSSGETSNFWMEDFEQMNTAFMNETLLNVMKNEGFI